MKKLEISAPLALPEELEVTEIAMIDEVFTITAYSTRIAPCCPLCGTPAQRFHSQYVRQITDLPSGGKRVCCALWYANAFVMSVRVYEKSLPSVSTPLLNLWRESLLACFKSFRLLALRLVGCWVRV